MSLFSSGNLVRGVLSPLDYRQRGDRDVWSQVGGKGAHRALVCNALVVRGVFDRTSLYVFFAYRKGVLNSIGNRSIPS